MAGLADQCAAVAAHVEHCVHLALGITSDDDRNTHDLDGLVRVLLRQFAGERKRQRDSLEDELDLVLEDLLVEVVRRRLEERRLGLIGGLVLGVGDQATHHRDRLFARRAIEDVAGQIGRDDGFGLGCLAHVDS